MEELNIPILGLTVAFIAYGLYLIVALARAKRPPMPSSHTVVVKPSPDVSIAGWPAESTGQQQ